MYESVTKHGPKIRKFFGEGKGGEEVGPNMTGCPEKIRFLKVALVHSNITSYILTMAHIKIRMRSY